MKKVKFKIPIYNFNVTFIEAESFNDKEKVIKEMKAMKCPQECIDEVIEGFNMQSMNSAWTFNNCYILTFLVIVLPCTDKVTRRSVVNHEKRHIEDKLIKHCDINDIEASAYIAGFISRFIY